MSFRVRWSSSTTRTVRGCFVGDEGETEIGELVGVPGGIIVVAVCMAAGTPAEVSFLGSSDKVSDFTSRVSRFASDEKAGGTGRDCSSDVDGQSSLGSRSHCRSGREGVISTRPSAKVISGVHGNNAYKNTRCSIIVRCVK